MGNKLPRIISDRMINSLINTAIVMNGGDITYVLSEYPFDEGSVLEDAGDSIRWANEDSSRQDLIALNDHREFDDIPDFASVATAEVGTWNMLSIPEALALIREIQDACSGAGGWKTHWRASDILDTLLWTFVSMLPGYNDAEQALQAGDIYQ